jgi:hypothetical protein
MCETPLETGYMLRETEARARALALASQDGGRELSLAWVRIVKLSEEWVAGALDAAWRPVKKVS